MTTCGSLDCPCAHNLAPRRAPFAIALPFPAQTPHPAGRGMKRGRGTEFEGQFNAVYRPRYRARRGPIEAI